MRIRKAYIRTLTALLALALWLWPIQTEAVQAPGEEAPAPLELRARAAVLMDGDTGRILYGKNQDQTLPMASTTKIMTCILALENASLDDVVEVSSYAASMPDVQLNIREGEQYRLEDLLYSLMLESHNDTAAAIAEHVAGTREAFADMMNQKARDIGCRDTFFITPNGLDAEDPDTGRIHSTTAAHPRPRGGGGGGDPPVLSVPVPGAGGVFTGDPGAVPRLFRHLRDQDLFLRQS
ncbi:d-alanyl-D-alanine carboxypeptidase [Clostridium sp. CAG:58]|nr:d-alanyl-D-alanine carboxypeptidase [Clostridium sp. CAG:58]